MIEFRSKDMDKKDRLINAALEEFGKNGYKKASTNSIVERAGVSKGLLYHYFKGKKELYDFLIDFCFETVSGTLKNEMDWEITDFFERLKAATKIKMELTNIYPSMYDFSIKYLAGLEPGEIAVLYEKYTLDLLAKVYYENIDFSLFREGIDVKKVTKVVQWTFEKYGEEIRDSGSLDLGEIIKGIDEYIALFKQSFYKQGGPND